MEASATGESLNNGDVAVHPAARHSEQLKKTGLFRPVTMETRCFHKKLENQKYTPKDFSTARYERNLRKKSFKLFKTPPQKYSWADLGPRSA